MEVKFTEQFFRDCKQLRKKYHNLDEDLQGFIKEFENGNVKGDKIIGIKSTYKVRYKNSSSKSGKSGGFRIIYYVQQLDLAYLLTIYAKNEKEDVSRNEILQILKREDLEN